MNTMTYSYMLGNRILIFVTTNFIILFFRKIGLLGFILINDRGSLIVIFFCNQRFFYHSTPYTHRRNSISVTLGRWKRTLVTADKISILITMSLGFTKIHRCHNHLLCSLLMPLCPLSLHKVVIDTSFFHVLLSPVESHEPLSSDHKWNRHQSCPIEEPCKDLAPPKCSLHGMVPAESTKDAPLSRPCLVDDQVKQFLLLRFLGLVVLVKVGVARVE